MPIGTGSGQHYSDEFSYELAQFFDATPNIEPQQPKPYKNKEQNTWDSNDYFDAMWDDYKDKEKAKNGKPTEEEMFKMSPNQLRQYIKNEDLFNVKK